jgi:hypothetical protein
MAISFAVGLALLFAAFFATLPFAAGGILRPLAGGVCFAV